MAVENEYKFMSDRKDFSACRSELESFLKRSGKQFTTNTKQSTDRFYDSEQMEITSKGCFIRQKTYPDGKCKLTVKKPISINGAVSREEIERVSDGTHQDLQCFCDECFSGVVLTETPTLVIDCERTEYAFEDMSNISIDKCQYISGTNRKDYLEIEYEVVSDTTMTAFDCIGLNDFVTEVLKFEPVFESKYVRGLRWKGLIRACQVIE